MLELKFLDNKGALRRLTRVEKSIQRFTKSHPGKLNSRQHVKLRKLLNKRAKALSKATGMKIHSIFE